MEYTNVSILTVILHYSFLRCYLWEKLGKEYLESVLCLITACDFSNLSKFKV